MAAPVALAFRVAASLTEFKANMAEMKAQLETTKGALKSVANSFDGSKIIAQGNAMVTVIKGLGGAAHLTEAEQARVNKTLSEAILKYQQLGREAPADMIRLRDATRQADPSSLVAGLGKVNSVLGVFGAAVSAGAVVQFGREVLDAGDSIVKMADQTGLTTEEVQRFQYIAGQSGTSIEALVGGVQNLQQRLGDEDTGAAGAMKRLRIHADAFNKLGTYQQMVTLADGVRSIKDPTDQASVSADLFGKSWKEILPAIKSGMKEVGDQAPIMADETVRSLDRIGDALARAKQQATAWGGGFVLAVEGAGFAVGDFLSKFNPEHFGVATSEIARVQAQLNNPDGLNDAINKLQRNIEKTDPPMKALTMSASEQRKVEEALAEGKKKLDAAYLKNQASAEAFKKAQDALFGRDLAARASDYLNQLGPLDNITKVNTDKQRELNAAMVAAIDVQQRAGHTINQTYVQLKLATDAVVQQIPYVGDLANHWKTVTAAMLGVNQPITLLGPNPAMFSELLSGLQSPAFITEGGTEFANALVGPSFKERMSAELGPAILGALQGGGDVGRTVGGWFGGELGKGILGEAGKGGVGDWLTKNLGKTLGGVFASVIPGLGTLLGSLGGQLMSKLFKTESRHVNDLRDEFLAKFGGAGTGAGSGFATLAAQLHDANADAIFQQVIKATKEGDFQRAVQAANRALEEQKAKQGDVAKAASESAAAQQAAINEITARYSESIGKLDSEYKGLAQSVAAEAEEAEMGVIETQERARMAQIEAEKAAKEMERDAEIAAKRETFDAMVEAGKSVDQQLRDLFAQPHDFPIRFTYPGGLPGGGSVPVSLQASGGDYITTRPTLFMSSEHNRPERVTFSGEGRTSHGGSGGGSRVALPVTISLGSRDLWTGMLDVAFEEGLV